MQTELYVSTIDDKNHTHNYKVDLTEPTIPAGETVQSIRKAGEFRFASILSPEQRALLTAAVR